MKEYNELPHSRESEESLLGALLTNPSLIDKVTLEPEEFFIVRHQHIYRAMQNLGSSDMDIVAVSEVLKRRDQDDNIIHLLNACPNSYNYNIHEKIIRDNASRRKILEIASKLANGAYDGGKNITEVVSENVSDLVMTAKPAGGVYHVGKFLKDLYEQAEERAKDPKVIYGLATGLHDFDKITHGLQKGEQFIMAGSPGTGKSLLAFQLACGMAANGHPGVIYELEMSGVALVRRQISALSKIKTYNMLSGNNMNEEWGSFSGAIEKMNEWPIHISEESNWTTIQIRADLARMKQEYGVEWFIIDYMELIADRYGKDDNERSAFVSRQLHSIIKDLDLAGLTIQSVTKQGFNSGRASMAHVSGSHTIHHDADQIAMLTHGTPDNPDQENVVTLSWEKQREADGAGMLTLWKRPGLPIFEAYKHEAKSKKQEWY